MKLSMHEKIMIICQSITSGITRITGVSCYMQSVFILCLSILSIAAISFMGEPIAGVRGIAVENDSLASFMASLMPYSLLFIMVTCLDSAIKMEQGINLDEGRTNSLLCRKLCVAIFPMLITMMVVFPMLGYSLNTADWLFFAGCVLMEVGLCFMGCSPVKPSSKNPAETMG